MSSSENAAEFSSAPASKYYEEYKSDKSTTACNNGIYYGYANGAFSVVLLD